MESEDKSKSSLYYAYDWCFRILNLLNSTFIFSYHTKCRIYHKNQLNKRIVLVKPNVFTKYLNGYITALSANINFFQQNNDTAKK